MTTIEYTCPKCNRPFPEDFGPMEAVAVKDGDVFLCPNCKTEILHNLMPASAASLQKIQQITDRVFEEIFHEDPVACAVAQREYRRLAPAGEAEDPRD